MGEGEKGKDMTTLHLDNHSAHSNDGTITAHGNEVVKGGEELAPMSPEERAGALKIAMEQDPGPNILSWRYMSFVFTAFIAILNSGDNGQSIHFMLLVMALETDGQDLTVPSCPLSTLWSNFRASLAWKPPRLVPRSSLCVTLTAAVHVS
jgi:hypothetical protein